MNLIQTCFSVTLPAKIGINHLRFKFPAQQTEFTSDVDRVLDGLPAAGAHLADVLAAVLVLGQADDQRGAVVGSGGADLNLKHRVTRFGK